MARYPLDRSAAHAALLELSPDGFGKLDMDATSAMITGFLDDYYASGSTNMWAYAQSWLSSAKTQATVDAINVGEIPADQDCGFWAAKAAEQQADEEAWGGRGPSESYDAWVAEGRGDTARLDPPDTMRARWAAENEPDPGPTERQLQDWNEHDAHADGLDLEADLE